LEGEDQRGFVDADEVEDGADRAVVERVVGDAVVDGIEGRAAVGGAEEAGALRADEDFILIGRRTGAVLDTAGGVFTLGVMHSPWE